LTFSKAGSICNVGLSRNSAHERVPASNARAVKVEIIGRFDALLSDATKDRPNPSVIGDGDGDGDGSGRAIT
jgi:hypothetical protein